METRERRDCRVAGGCFVALQREILLTHARIRMAEELAQTLGRKVRRLRAAMRSLALRASRWCRLPHRLMVVTMGSEPRKAEHGRHLLGEDEVPPPFRPDPEIVTSLEGSRSDERRLSEAIGKMAQRVEAEQ